MEHEIRSVNWHIISRCNYGCKFCFAQGMKGEFTDLQEAEKILKRLKDDLRIEKINFVGGEPLMHPHIFELVKISKTLGFTVSITTNGYFLNETLISKLAPFVDWIGISIDSANEETEKALGRGSGSHVAHSVDVCYLVRKYGIRLKINTIVTQLNLDEDISEFIIELDPERWKVFQFLHIKGQNDGAVNLMAISAGEFQEFKEKNESVKLKGGRMPIFESNKDMEDSYLMLGPSGNFFTNRGKVYTEIPFASVDRRNISKILNSGKYISRGGRYDWG